MAALRTFIVPAIICAIAAWAGPRNLPLAVQALLTVCIVTAFGPLVYRVAYQSLAGASSLVLLIVSVGVHFAMTGLGLLFFGLDCRHAQGLRADLNAAAAILLRLAPHSSFAE